MLRNDDEGMGRGRHAVVAEADTARAQRSLARCVRMIEFAERAADPVVALARIVPVARSLLHIERITSPSQRQRCLRSRLDAIATHSILASDVMGKLKASLDAPAMEALPPDLLVAVFSEAVHVVEDCGDAFSPVEVSVSLTLKAGVVTLDLRTGPAVRGALSRTGTEAIARLGTLTAAWGGTIRRVVENGRLQLVATMVA